MGLVSTAAQPVAFSKGPVSDLFVLLKEMLKSFRCCHVLFPYSLPTKVFCILQQYMKGFKLMKAQENSDRC